MASLARYMQYTNLPNVTSAKLSVKRMWLKLLKTVTTRGGCYDVDRLHDLDCTLDGRNGYPLHDPETAARENE